MTDIEQALTSGEAPWVEIEFRTLTYWAFSPIEPECDGHMIFAPISRNMSGLVDCYRAAYQFGFQGHVSDKWPKYRIVQDVGRQGYPFVELIPIK